MKKSIRFIVCHLFLALVCLVCFSCAPEDNNNASDENNDGGTEVVYSEGLAYSLSDDASFYSVSGIGKCYDTDIIIPPEYKGLPVTEIAPYAFYNLRSIQSIVLPESIEKIGEYAFLGCYSIDYSEFDNAYYLGTLENKYAFLILAESTDISTLKISESTKLIAPYAFSGCSMLESVTMPDSVEFIGAYAFKDCVKLKSVMLGNGIKSVGFSAFINCKSLEYTIYSGGKYIGSSSNPYLLFVSAAGRQIEECSIHEDTKIIASFAFEYCGTLEYIEVPEGVIEIGSNAFGYCSSLETVKLPQTLSVIPSYLFYECISLKNAELPSQAKYISDYCFYGCESLESINLSSGLKSIQKHAFSGCKKLSSIAFSEKLENIGENAFFGCKALTDIVLGNLVEKISDYAFAECTAIERIQLSSELVEIGKYAFNNNTSLTALNLPNKLEIIGEGAFVNCCLISEISIPESIKTIGANAFYGWAGLVSVNVTNLTKWCGVEFGNSSANPLFYANTLLLDSLVVNEIDIPDGVEQISAYSFYGYSTLTRVKIPKSVKAIADHAFEECYRLIEIVNLSDLEIEIGKRSFGEIALNALSITDSVENTAIFTDTDGFVFCQTEQTLYLVGYIGNESKIILPSNFKGRSYKISNYAFFRNEFISEVEISESVSEIGRYSFAECKLLKDVIISDTVVCIESSAFALCESLASVTLGANLASIGESAFYSAQALREIEIPEKVAFIGQWTEAKAALIRLAGSLEPITTKTASSARPKTNFCSMKVLAM